MESGVGKRWYQKWAEEEGTRGGEGEEKEDEEEKEEEKEEERILRISEYVLNKFWKATPQYPLFKAIYMKRKDGVG
ncbi:hypothetical protein M0804_004922 [Polistes exclamans]|nr:hypothetical protein M0804_004922 [Polistes exclamans]